MFQGQLNQNCLGSAETQFTKPRWLLSSCQVRQNVILRDVIAGYI